MRRAIIAILAVVAGGCSAISYSGEQAGPLAKLRIAVPKWLGNNLVDVWAYDGANCNNERQWFKLNNYLLLPSPSMRLGIPLWSYNDTAAKEVHVRADTKLYLLFRGQTAMSLCGVPVVAELRQGRSYEMTYDEPELGKQCSVVFSEIVDSPNGPTKVLVREYENIGNEGCERAFLAFRLI